MTNLALILLLSPQAPLLAAQLPREKHPAGFLPPIFSPERRILDPDGFRADLSGLIAELSKPDSARKLSALRRQLLRMRDDLLREEPRVPPAAQPVRLSAGFGCRQR